MGMGGRPGRPRPARDAHQPLLVRRNYLLRPRDIAFPDEVMRSRVWPTLGLGYYVSQPFDPMAVSSHNSSFNTPGYPGLLGLLICQPPGVLGFIITCLTHPIFILHPCLYWPMVGYTCYYLPYLSSCIYPFLYSGGSLLPLLIILHFHLSCLYLLFNIFCITHLLTLLNLPLYIPNYSLTSFPQPTFIYSPLLALPLLILWLSFSACPIQHYFTSLTCVPFIQNITYPYIHNTTKSLITTQNITPFSLSFPFYYSLFPIFNLNMILYCFISYSTKLYSPLLPFSLFTIHYSLLSITTLLSLSLLPTFHLPHSLLSTIILNIITHIYSLSISPSIIIII